MKCRDGCPVAQKKLDPSRKGAILGSHEGIFTAMNCAAFGLILWIPSVIAAFALTSRTDKSPPNSGNWSGVADGNACADTLASA